MSTGLERILEDQRATARFALEEDRYLNSALYADEDGNPRIVIFFRLEDREDEEKSLPKEVALAALTSVFKADKKCVQMNVAIDCFFRSVPDSELEEFEASPMKLSESPLSEEAISHYTLKKNGDEVLIKLSVDRYGYNDDGSILWREPRETDSSEFMSIDMLSGGSAQAFKVPPLVDQQGEPYEAKDLLDILSIAENTFHIQATEQFLAEYGPQGASNESN